LKLHAEVIPCLLVKGVAPDGREYDLSSIFGDWLGTENVDTLALCKTGGLNRAQVRAFWQWSGRRDKPPKSLKLYLRNNPDYGNWVTMRTARDFVSSKLNGDNKLAEEALMRALRNGQIASRGVREQEGGRLTYTSVEFSTVDMVKWLKLEFDITVSKHDIACFPGNGLLLDIIAGGPPR
jgi:hypothetical protein